jgi:Cu(I)/Ag(I) efflux system membrane fusion protein
LRFDNPDESLKPNMFANVTIYAGPTSDTVVIPREALIRTGDEERVILSMGEGRYQPRKVIAGIESGDYVEIQRGLAAGDRVVTSGQFLIDSEASLKASLQRMSSPGMPMESEPAPITGTGILREILAGENKVNMTHDPIPAIKWSEMTMDFKVKPNVELDGFKPEDKVMFELEKTGDAYIIKSMQKQDSMGGM